MEQTEQYSDGNLEQQPQREPKSAPVSLPYTAALTYVMDCFDEEGAAAQLLSGPSWVLLFLVEVSSEFMARASVLIPPLVDELKARGIHINNAPAQEKPARGKRRCGTQTYSLVYRDPREPVTDANGDPVTFKIAKSVLRGAKYKDIPVENVILIDSSGDVVVDRMTM